MKNAPPTAGADEKAHSVSQIDKLTHFHEQKPIYDLNVLGFLQWTLMPFISLALTCYILYVPLMDTLTMQNYSQVVASDHLVSGLHVSGSIS